MLSLCGPDLRRLTMLTHDDLASVPLLAGLPASRLDQVLRVAADITLRAGDYAVNEGDVRAFYAVVAGRLEITKRIDGVETPLGFREPGDILGEVPLAYGMPFQSSARAVEASRVLRLGARHYRDLAADAPSVANVVPLAFPRR